MTDRVAAASRQSIARGSASFALAARLLDSSTRESVQHFYAWCRYCDDVVDGQSAGQGRVAATRSPRERLAALEAETRGVLAGRPSNHPAFAALARVAEKHALPDHIPLDILQGFRMDVDGRVFRTLDDLFDYCYGVAGAVGLGMAIVMGVRRDDRAALDRACDLGLAFQLTNIARDVMEDARIGRLYLPADLFGGRSVTPGFVLDPANHRDVVGATHAVVELAERYYASGRIGLSALPWRSAWAIATALGVYREIGTRVRRIPNPWAQRQSVPAWKKLVHVATGSAVPFRRAGLTPPDAPRTGLWTRA